MAKSIDAILDLFQLEVESWNIGKPAYKTLTKDEAKAELLRLILDTIKANQKGQFEDDAGEICWYLKDLEQAIQDIFDGKEK